MRLLGVHPNVISLTNLWTRDESNDSELYLAMELMDSDLHTIIQSKQQLSEPHFQVLMKQLLLGVQAMHRLGVLHRDLKPGVDLRKETRIERFTCIYLPSVQ